MTKKRKIIIVIIIAFSILSTTFSLYIYQVLFTPNIQIEKPADYLLIPTGADFKTVQDSLYLGKHVQDITAFSLLAKLMKYHKMVKPGRYELSPDMSNLAAIRLLRSGGQKPLNLTFNNIRLKSEIAEKICKNIEIPPQAFEGLLYDTAYISQYGFNKNTIIGMFIPNTYEVYWTISAEELFNRMHDEYQKFWNESRKKKAKELEMSLLEISTLASIVQAETNQRDEAADIAGVYINRLNKGMLLQADPTLVFAIGDFSIRRVLNIHKKIASPYNTYKYPGLPPGPINMPSITYIDAVLNYKKHNYLYFCAKEDFSGYHNFAVTLQQHQLNARKYQHALNNIRQ